MQTIDLEELFKKRPFVYSVGDDYYVFGAGVCKKYGGSTNKTITLPYRYQKYYEALDEQNLSQGEAWKAYHGVLCVANEEFEKDDHTDLNKTFDDFGFTEIEKTKIQEQLEQSVHFFKKYKLVDFLEK